MRLLALPLLYVGLCFLVVFLALFVVVLFIALPFIVMSGRLDRDLKLK